MTNDSKDKLNEINPNYLINCKQPTSTKHINGGQRA